MIKIDFERTSADGLIVYRDALYLEEDHSYTEEEIEAMKQARFDRWYLAVTTPPEVMPEVIAEEVPVNG